MLFGEALPYLLTKIRRSVKAFAVKNNAKENPRQTCEGGGVKVSCREKPISYLLTKIRRSVKALAVESNANAHSRQT